MAQTAIPLLFTSANFQPLALLRRLEVDKAQHEIMLPRMGEAVGVGFQRPVGPVLGAHRVADDQLANVDVGHFAHPDVHRLEEDLHRFGRINFERGDLFDQGIVFSILPA